MSILENECDRAADVEPFAQPVAAKGSQGWWFADANLLRAMETQDAR